MITVFSGCDGVGKSSISETVCSKLGGQFTHFSAPKNKETAKKEYFDFIAKTTEDGHMYICDRFYEGEWTYAPIYRKYIGDYAREIEQTITKGQNYLYVYVTAELETIIKRTRARGEDFAREEDFQQILDNYHAFLMDQRLPFTIINNGEGKNIEDGINQAIRDIAHLNLIWETRRNTGLLPRGNMRPKYFVVGPNPDTNFGTPALAMYNGEVAENVISKLKTKGIYLDCWFTTPEHASFENRLLNPQETIYWRDLVNDKI